MKNQLMMLKETVCLAMLLFLLEACSSPAEKIKAEPVKTVEETKPTMHAVEIIQMKFYPAELKVKKGDKVVFVNHDLVTHDVTEESKKAWSSSPLATDQTWILEVIESVNYYCSIHPVMKGSIVVE
ncbi:plastocyanin/azurin family copper-binding protein [Terrimonas pollutisoli]|uniref:plastocyanin/azurin family copper-binding protein n=1 Tax=Terrimonas pollutisoli TaxID=3034147 RepID=UPI0023ED273F|nr:plastocyanin/azurin family copper-binding protein [Terrimonas sp. H1YJ31]